MVSRDIPLHIVCCKTAFIMSHMEHHNDTKKLVCARQSLTYLFVWSKLEEEKTLDAVEIEEPYVISLI